MSYRAKKQNLKPLLAEYFQKLYPQHVKKMLHSILRFLPISTVSIFIESAKKNRLKSNKSPPISRLSQYLVLQPRISALRIDTY